jgi:hypothetical protein
VSNSVIVGVWIQFVDSIVRSHITEFRGSKRLVAALLVGFPVCSLAFARAIEHRLASATAFKRLRQRSVLTLQQIW